MKNNNFFKSKTFSFIEFIGICILFFSLGVIAAVLFVNKATTPSWLYSLAIIGLGCILIIISFFIPKSK